MLPLNMLTFLRIQQLQYQSIYKQKLFMSSSDVSVTTQKLNIQSANSNPYELLKKMNKIISDQKQQIQQYEIAFESFQRQKQILLNQKKKLENVTIQLVYKIDILKGNKIGEKKNQNSTSLTINAKIGSNLQLMKNKIMTPTSKRTQYSSIRPFEKMDPVKSGIFDVRDHSLNNATKRLEQTQSTRPQEYIPQPIRLSLKSKAETSVLSFINNTTLQNFNKKQYIYAQNMLQAFLILGPDIAEFKNKRNSQKGKDTITVKASSLYTYGKYYKDHKTQFITQIAKRAFPEGCKLKKKLLDHNDELNELISFTPNQNLSEDYFVFTLKGDQSLFKATMENPSMKKSYLYVTNANYFLFIVCLKLPDFIYVRDEKNYHKKQNQVWIGQKIYAIATYYPFFSTHTSTLYRINSIMSKIMTRKVLIDNENVLSWNVTKNVYDVQKNLQVAQILHYFANKKPDYNQVCYHSETYFGTLPEFGYKSLYSIALYCCPVFFSNFSYQQMLLLLTAIFCQKTLIFLSKIQTMATLSALFLINLISPFQYSQPILLNCDSDKVKSMIFQFPFPMISSIKKTDQNIQQILQLFAQSNIMRLMQHDAQYIVIDVDSNSILYHHALDKLFSQCIVPPSDKIKQTYLQVNSCQSKSFSLPKALVRQNFKPNTKPKSQLEKRKEQMKKCVKEYQQKISTNQTKIPVYRRNQKHQQLLKMLTQYVQQFTLNHQNDYQVIGKLETCHKNMRNQIVKNHLTQKYKNRNQIISKFLQSQMYANYLDSILQN